MKRVYANSFWLMIAHLAGYAIPLLELPILARALGPESFGSLLFALSVALSFSLIVEYGFNLSASREVARNIDNPAEIASIFGQVSLAKMILAAVVVSVSGLLVMMTGLPSIMETDLIFPAILFFVAFGFSPFWYFQGTEKMVRPVILNLGLRFFSLFLLWVYVESPEHASRALLIMGGLGLINTLVTTTWVYSEIRVFKCSLRGSLSQIRIGWHTFVYRSSNDVLMSASPAILGFAAGRLETGIFVPAEKLVKAAAGLALPVLTAFFPYLSKRGLGRAREGWWLVCILSGGGVIAAVALWILAPVLIDLLLGENYRDSIPLMNLFVWLIPLRIANQSLGIAILFPNGADRYAGYSLVIASILAITSGYTLATYYGAAGMVIGLLLAEALLFGLLVFKSLKL